MSVKNRYVTILHFLWSLDAEVKENGVHSPYWKDHTLYCCTGQIPECDGRIEMCTYRKYDGIFLKSCIQPICFWVFGPFTIYTQRFGQYTDIQREELIHGQNLIRDTWVCVSVWSSSPTPSSSQSIYLKSFHIQYY